MPYMVLLVSAIMACTKKEYMPPVVGDALPYTEEVPNTTLTEALEASGNSLFYAAWQRSHLPARLSTQEKYTVLAPGDAAMKEAGWSAESIASATAETLDTVLMAHVFYGRITKEVLALRNESYQAVGLLEYPGLDYGYHSLLDGEGFDTYRFQAMIALSGDHLLINGLEFTHGAPVLTADGYIWPLDGIVKAPKMTAWEFLKHDSRFSLYVGITEYTDSLYDAIFTQANGYHPEQGQMYAQFQERVGYGLWPWNAYGHNKPVVSNLNTFFIPTDDAFYQAGFQSLQDLISFNERRGLPKVEWFVPMSNNGFYRVIGEFATDSLLDYHHQWGLRYGGYGSLNPYLIRYDYLNWNSTTYGLYYDGAYLVSGPLPVLYSNDLRQELFDVRAVYNIQSYSNIQSNTVIFGLTNTAVHYIPFQVAGGGAEPIRLSPKGAAGGTATIVDKDITTLTGVVHVVDHLLLPPGFIMD
ncbi:Fasciclin domain-containing protein [bacterium A37T11]|nr:Fasciclin domain-containing protein [bacterium A37T11]